MSRNRTKGTSFDDIDALFKNRVDIEHAERGSKSEDEAEKQNVPKVEPEPPPAEPPIGETEERESRRIPIRHGKDLPEDAPVQYSFRLTAGQRHDLIQWCEKHGYSVAGVLRTCIEKVLKGEIDLER